MFMAELLSRGAEEIEVINRVYPFAQKNSKEQDAPKMVMEIVKALQLTEWSEK